MNQRRFLGAHQLGGNSEICKYAGRKLHIIIFLCSLPIFYMVSQEALFRPSNTKDVNNYTKVEEEDRPFDKNAPIFMTTVCEGNSDKEVKSFDILANNVHRQIQQTIIMLKSAVVMSRSYFNFIIAVDQDYLFDAIVEKVNVWPQSILKKFSLQRRKVWFPPGSDIKSSFRVCSAARLFFPQHMPDIESAVYVDTDTLFMKAPEELWKEFQHFDSLQMCGLSGPEMYDFSSKMPYYGKSGLNGGVWMMNMTRMRNFPGGWENICLSTYEQYKEFVMYADQDIGNIIFHEFPQYVYELGCSWNIRARQCKFTSHLCKEIKETGVSILHGNEFTFFGKDLKTTAIYNGWKDFEPGDSLEHLLKTFRDSLAKVDKTKFGFCSYVEGYDTDLTKGIEEYIKSLE